MSGEIINAFIPAIPELANHRTILDQAEQDLLRGAMKQFRSKLDEMMARTSPKQTAQLRSLTRDAQPAPRQVSRPSYDAAASGLDILFSPAFAADVDAGSLLASINALVITEFLGEACDQGRIPSDSDFKGWKSEYKDKMGSAKIEVVKESDGTPTVAVETTMAMPLFFLEANSRLSLTASAMCPDESGKIQFKVKLGQAGRAGSGNSMIYDKGREATITAYADDNAELAGADIQTTYSERATPGTRQVYVEAATSWHLDGSNWKSMQMTDYHPIRVSSQATNEDWPLIQTGIKQSLGLAVGALMGAKERWQSGACLKINATSPGTVKPKATSTIPVSVTHRKEGTPVPAKMTVELSGGQSVAPSVIPKTPGDVTHVAVDEPGKTMTITLTATSKRGKAKEELKIQTAGNVFTIEGGADEFHGTGIVCDFTKPFKISGSGVTVTFTPSSEKAGKYTYKGNMSGFGVSGHGTYDVTYQGDAPVHMTARGPGSVQTPLGTPSAEGTEEYTISPMSGTCPYSKMELD